MFVINFCPTYAFFINYKISHANMRLDAIQDQLCKIAPSHNIRSLDRMGKSTINTCLCDLFSVGVSKSPSLVNLLINYPCYLAVLSRRLPNNVNWNICIIIIVRSETRYDRARMYLAGHLDR